MDDTALNDKGAQGRMEAESEVTVCAESTEASSDFGGNRFNSEWVCSCRGGSVENFGGERDV